MKTLIIVGLLALCVGSISAVDPYEHNKFVCFWNSTSFERPGLGKFQIEDLRSVVPLCTHLVYGYAGISAANYEVVPLHPNLDMSETYAFYRRVLQLKQMLPNLKVYLSIGGNADPYEETHKYLTLTESPTARQNFINSILRLLTQYQFDGIDLAWQFPEEKVKKNRGVFGSVWHNVKGALGYGKFKDLKTDKHRKGFTVLVRDLKEQLKTLNKALTLTVLPHINASVYYDANLLAPNLDAVHLMAFDQKTPERNPTEADYSSPIHESYGRISQDNVDSSVKYWLQHGTPGGKIVIGISTFARTWKLTKKSGMSGVPPLNADGPGAEGPYTKMPGFLSYGEVCALLTNSTIGKVQVDDPSGNFGSYGYLLSNPLTGADGMWIGYESPKTAAYKASYAKSNGLGGVAIIDLSTDDFLGKCRADGEIYPILRAAKYRLL